jgi:hypothetical protein
MRLLMRPTAPGTRQIQTARDGENRLSRPAFSTSTFVFSAAFFARARQREERAIEINGLARSATRSAPDGFRRHKADSLAKVDSAAIVTLGLDVHLHGWGLT